ncbi:MAG TPA: twin transmembrane helix small protein [Steroidobacteraceae bacterium]|nr:twin transmembrane helix small protein [Steroidobacteraceae bacterium]
MSIVIIALLLGIVASLGHALTSMSSGPERSKRMAQALTVRITLSIALFGLLLIGNHFGWIQPHGVY